MSRYIDADKLNRKKKYLFKTQGGCFPKSEWFIKVEDLHSAPTIDAVKVVRCKDCANDGLSTCPLCYIEKHALIFINHDPEFFCAAGERRKERR